jgi:hypothetical protein
LFSPAFYSHQQPPQQGTEDRGAGHGQGDRARVCSAIDPRRLVHPQPHDPPQHPPPLVGAAISAPLPGERITPATPSNRTVSSCPSGQAAGADDSLMGRDSVNVAPQVRQRNS